MKRHIIGSVQNCSFQCVVSNIQDVFNASLEESCPVFLIPAPTPATQFHDTSTSHRSSWPPSYPSTLPPYYLAISGVIAADGFSFSHIWSSHPAHYLSSSLSPFLPPECPPTPAPPRPSPQPTEAGALAGKCPQHQM